MAAHVEDHVAREEAARVREEGDVVVAVLLVAVRAVEDVENLGLDGVAEEHEPHRAAQQLSERQAAAGDVQASGD